ncbi:tRNA (guanine(10)-N(2))-dimethyltransferase [Candidatus Woesearchaeota archaeon]|nr:tRNA (guanine(10)-N(2))-dimethyltransferase [Candidatus Woesearchaeota archaeon]
MEKLTEGKIAFFAPVAKIVSKDLEVFYNPVMQLNRDISITLLKALGRKKLVIADPLAGTGIRSLRFLKELPKGMIEQLRVNDVNGKFPALFKKQLKQNKLSAKNVVISRRDASKFMLDGPGLDYIDIDPFGSPNQFLDAATKFISRDGVLAVTATDTGALAGAFKDACRRKYWAEPLRNELMHEVGIRILIRKCQLIAMQHDRALMPIFVHSSDHYVRVYLHAEKSKEVIKTILDRHGFVHYCNNCFARTSSGINVERCACGTIMRAAGPLWLGQLWNHAVVKKMITKAPAHLKKFLHTIHEESHIPEIGFYDLHKLASALKVPVPPTETILARLRKKGFKAAQTHFRAASVRTDAPLKVVKRILKS